MSHQSDTCLGIREQRRATHRIARRRERLRHHMRKGQTLLIFVLSFTVLLNGLGVAPITLRAVAQAEYAPPVQIAARQNYIGDRIECSPGNSENTNSSYCSATTKGNVNRLQYYFASMSGPSQLQESGDP